VALHLALDKSYCVKWGNGFFYEEIDMSADTNNPLSPALSKLEACLFLKTTAVHSRYAVFKTTEKAAWLLRMFVKIGRSVWLPEASAWYWCLFLGSWLLAGAQAAFCRDDVPRPLLRSIIGITAFNVGLKDSLLSIDAKQAPWQELLKQIEDKTHISLHCAIPLTGSVTVSFPALPVKEALERLFGPGADFVFRYPKEASQPFATPKEVWVLGSFVGHDTQAVQTTPSKAENAHDSEVSAPSTAENTLQEASNLDNETVDELVERARNDENAESRIQALASLSGHGQTDGTAAKLALDTALADKDPNVREYAVQALANQAGQEATEQIRLALQDPDSGVRVKAVESVALNGQGIALLQEALANGDEIIQAIAADRLKQVTQETPE
jgi:HEAT repeats